MGLAYHLRKKKALNFKLFPAHQNKLITRVAHNLLRQVVGGTFIKSGFHNFHVNSIIFMHQAMIEA